MFNPLPAIALLPLALIWFGLGYGSIVFVIIHSVLWAVALNTHSGFLSVSNTLRMVGRNYGLSGLRYVARDPHSGGVSEHPHRPQDRLGVRVAHADRRRARVRRVVGIRRSRLVHLREQEPARDSVGVRRSVHRDPDRPPRRERRSSARSKPARCGAGACRADAAHRNRTIVMSTIRMSPHLPTDQLSTLPPRVPGHRSRGGAGVLRRVPRMRRGTFSQRRLGRLRLPRPPDRRAQGGRGRNERRDQPRRRPERAGPPLRRGHWTCREWEALAARLKAGGTKFIVEPYVRFRGLARRAGDDVLPRSVRQCARVQGVRRHRPACSRKIA